MSDQMRFRQKLKEAICAAEAAYRSAKGEEAQLYDDCVDNLLDIQFRLEEFNEEVADADPPA